MNSLDDLLDLLVKRGAAQYGYEPVTQLAHALQSAYLAERAHEPPALIVAALMHDLGHLADGADVTEVEHGRDDHHELRALDLLGRWFDADVLEPIRLHVMAKRYLCAAEAGYYDGLSDASKASLAVQGGVFSEIEAELFLQKPYAHDAVRLRRYDERAKEPRAAPPPPAHFLQYLEAARRRESK